MQCGGLNPVPAEVARPAQPGSAAASCGERPASGTIRGHRADRRRTARPHRMARPDRGCGV